MNYFDNVDIFILANRLSPRELRNELHWAEIQGTLVGLFLGTPYQRPEDSFPYQDYAASCREAIEWQRRSKPKIKPVKGKVVDIDRIKQTIDIVTVVERYTKLRKAGRNFIGCCPIHPDKHPSLTVYPDQQTFHCYGCNQGGDVISFIQAVESTDFRGAAAILGGV